MMNGDHVTGPFWFFLVSLHDADKPSSNELAFAGDTL
jgi:hypothetical protein